jgi:hypothetical protein
VALLGLAGSTSAGVIAGWLKPVLIGVSVLLLAYSFFVLYVLGRGSRTSVVVTWLSLAFVIGFWTWQLFLT